MNKFLYRVTMSNGKVSIEFGDQMPDSGSDSMKIHALAKWLSDLSLKLAGSSVPSEYDDDDDWDEEA